MKKVFIVLLVAGLLVLGNVSVSAEDLKSQSEGYITSIHPEPQDSIVEVLPCGGGNGGGGAPG